MQDWNDDMARDYHKEDERDMFYVTVAVAYTVIVFFIGVIVGAYFW